jgi:Na+-transporting methylmalonyl-CoA/oxaloacetate decarboxylase gamma subunit
MNALDEINVTGAPAIVTALGMGTVFLCLVLLYVITRLVGRWLPGLLGMAEGAESAEGVEAAAEAEAGATAAAPKESPAGDEAIVAAMTLALARHRFSRLRSVEEPRGADPWKIAGRIRTLRVR